MTAIPVVLGWNGEGSFRAPTAPEPFLDNRVFDTDFFGPIRNAHGPALEGEIDIAAPVSCLDGDGSPSAIVGAIPLGVVDSVERVPFRFRSHVGQEVAKVAPSITDGYPPSSVAVEFDVRWLHNTPTHADPTLKFRSFGTPTTRAVNGLFHASGVVDVEASATLCAARCKAVGRNESVPTANASAMPDDAFTAVAPVGWNESGETAEYLVGQISSFGVHNYILPNAGVVIQ